MTLVLSEPADLSLENLRRVALKGEDFRFSKAALKRIAGWHKDFHAFLDGNQDRFIYGVTSGYGPRAKHRVSAAERARRREAEVPFTGLSFGDGVWPESHVRAMIFSLAGMALHGAPALSLQQATAIPVALDGPLPRIPKGGITSPGEMMVLFYLYRVLPALVDGTIQCSSVNGAAGSVAIAGLRALAARRRLALAEAVFALSVEAILCPLEHFEPALKPLWGDPYEGQAIDALNHWLAGVARDDRRPFQAPVSYRILPRVLGQARRAVAALEEAAEVSLQGMITNPTFVTADHAGGECTLSNGGFHEAAPAQALDNVMAAWVDLASIGHRHASKLHKGSVSRLPDKLGGAGVSTSYIEYVAGDKIEEMRRLAGPSLLSPGDPGSSDQDDVNAPGFLACRMEERVARLFDDVMVLVAVSASQALHVAGRPGPPKLRRLLRALRRDFPVVTQVRDLGVDAQALAEAFHRHAEAAEDLT